MNTKLVRTAVIIFMAIIIGCGAWFFTRKTSTTSRSSTLAPRPQKIITDSFVPLSADVSSFDGRNLNPTAAGVPITPSEFSEDFVVTAAKLTVKDGFALAFPEAQKWSKDASLVFIKSVGSVTSDGKSSEWQIVFGSKEKIAGYEVVTWQDKIASQKTLDGKLAGFEVPQNWYDSSGAVQSLTTMPQFATATISGISFFYNEDSKDWMYGLATSRGATGMHVK